MQTNVAVRIEAVIAVIMHRWCLAAVYAPPPAPAPPSSAQPLGVAIIRYGGGG